MLAVFLLLIFALPLNIIEISVAAENSTNSAQITDISKNQEQTDNNTLLYTKNTTKTSSIKNTSLINSVEGDPNTNNSLIQTTLSSNNTATSYGEGSVSKIIKVLIYNGSYVSSSCVNGIKSVLAYANSNNLLSGITFTYTTSKTITSSILASYDVLYMPGGTGGYYYLNTGSISGTAIKNFVSNGGGYIGTCAGAYSGCYYVDGWYYGWGVAPHVRCKEISYEGKVNITITSAGQELFGYSGTKTVSHYNGPAMYVSGTAIKFATYADSKTGYKNYAAIVGDYYGNGRTVLIGPHPELSPQNPDILAKLIAWGANVSFETGNDDTSTSTVTMSQLFTAASSVKSFYETNSRLPNYVNLNDQQVSMSTFLYLLSTGTLQVNSGSTAPIVLENVNSAISPSGTIKSGNINKSEFLSLAQRIITFISTNGRVPNYVSTSLGNMSFEKTVYLFSKIISYYQTNSRLPSYIAMT